MDEERASLIYIGIWLGWGIISWFFIRNKPIPEKRKWYPILSAGTGVVMSSFILMASGSILYAVLGALILAPLCFWMTKRFSKFCMSCGRVIAEVSPFERVDFCSKCGAAVENW